MTYHVPRRRLLASALLIALAQPALAQDTQDADPARTDTAGPATLDTIVVTGIRNSLAASMNLKRDSQGVVDGIVAEDIGKFPDTNLAESLQRISGVSIDRTASGEGSRVTVRGVGPDFNLVLLNGRQMPASSIGDTFASSSRAFDFANLASEAVSEIEVYKTGRASTPTGGIGATINIKTMRPLDNPGMHANVGLKGVYDQSLDSVPDSYGLDSVTPEISGIFSNTTADGRFGIAVSASYQERDSGYSQANVGAGWRPHYGDAEGWSTLPLPGTPGSENIENRPGAEDLYALPQNFGYSTTGVKRERTNGQIALQWAPTDNITTTLDYTYAEQKVQQQRNELSVWFNYGPGSSAWTDGPIAGPIRYGEFIEAANSDIAMAGAKFGTKNENRSLGFNVDWAVNDALDLTFDIHRSTAESGADSPYGSNAVLGAAAFVRGDTTVDFSNKLPLLSIRLPEGRDAVDASDMMVTGSSFRNSFMRSEVEQAQASGTFRFGDYSSFDFGIGMSEIQNRTAYGFVDRPTWGGIPGLGPEAYPDDLFQADDMNRYFSSFNGHIPSGRFYTFNFDALRDLAAELSGDESLYLPPTSFTTDQRTTEKSRSAYFQWSNSWDLGTMPFHATAGVRYEETEVTATALVTVPTAIDWVADNEFFNVLSESEFQTLTGKYSYWLPNLDLRLELRDDLVLRGSYGQSIGRPGWNDIQGGLTVDPNGRVDSGTGRLGNPGLRPLESDNFDLSLEWYYNDASFMSVGYFRKNIDNYIGTTTIVDTPYDVTTPAGGAYFNAAVTAGCASSNMECIREYIFANFAGAPGVDVENGIITGQPGDPLANFRITVPTNERSASLDGWEINLQHMFGESGFGVAANYTIVDSGLTYDNYSLGSQFALVGLSDSANLVGFYDKGPWQIRAAYNWRDEFLSATSDGAGANPSYVEAYGQFDLSVGYAVTERLTLQLEAINLTDETQRVHGRHENQLLFATQTGPRYMFGLRYNFF